MSTTPIDYTALAKQAGAIDSQPAPAAGPTATASASIDYTALAKQAGAIDSQPAPSSQPGLLTRAANVIGEAGAGLVPGAVESTGETLQSLPYIGKKIISPAAMQAEREYFKPGSAAEKAGQGIGAGMESILEFVLGDEALKGLAIADKVGIASKISKIAQDSPYIGALLRHGVTAARTGTVGTAEALAKGATPAQAVKTGAAVGAGGGLLEAATEAAPKVIQTLVNPFRKPATTAEVPAAPGIVKQVLQGEKVAQAPAQAATRAAVKVGGGEVGLATAQPASLRTIVEEPISTVNGLKKGIYGQVDKAAGTDLKTLYDKLDNINDKIDLEASGSPEEARLEAQRTSQMQTIEDAKTAARAKGVDVDKLLTQGDALHTREMALRDVQKAVFKNPNIIEGNTAMGMPENIKVDSGIKALQKLQDNTKFGAPRLEQAFGKAGAQQLLQDMYAAQRMGVTALSRQQVAKWIGGILGAGTILKGVGMAESAIKTP